MIEKNNILFTSEILKHHVELQHAIHYNIMKLNDNQMNRKNILSSVDEVFEEYKKFFMDNKEKQNRRELLQNYPIFDLAADDMKNISQQFRIVSDFLNYDIPYKIMRETIHIPLDKKESVCIDRMYGYLQKENYLSVLKVLIQQLKECDFNPAYNEIIAYRNIITQYANQTHIDLSKVIIDYDMFKSHEHEELEERD